MGSMPALLLLGPEPTLAVFSDIPAPKARFAGIQPHSTARDNEALSPLNMFDILLPRSALAPATSAPGGQDWPECPLCAKKADIRFDEELTPDHGGRSRHGLHRAGRQHPCWAQLGRRR